MMQRCFRYLARFFCRKAERFPDSPDQLILAWRRARLAKSLGFLISQARQSRNLSFEQLQTVTGIHAAYLERLENDAVSRPSLFLLVQLAETLELGLDEMVVHIEPYQPQDLLELEQRWRFCLSTQPGDRSGLLMLAFIERMWERHRRLPLPKRGPSL
ncbi:MAG TPA: helix-turn-helix transcriptional regulator [Chroococcales cyanobacterium]|jgi:transcriptional regulator with XRE-family HTH domain